MINEELNKSDLRKIKSLIRKEIKEFEKESLEKKIKSILKKDFKEIENLDKDFEKKVEDITKSVMQAFHDLLYKEKYILKTKVKR